MTYKCRTTLELLTVESDVPNLISFDDIIAQFAAADSRKCF